MKRILSFLLSAVLLFSLFVTTAPHASAAGNLKTSDKGIQLIKNFEGFSAMAYPDNNQYSIGYGTACKVNEYPNGITEAKADELLRKEVAKLETYLDKFATKYGLTFSQHQYDALISFTYNLGTNWMNNTSTFRSAITDKAKGNDLIFAMTMWCNAGGKIHNGLVQRRLAEANLYLNGVYSTKQPSNYKYVLFDNNSEDAVTTVKIQGYDATRTDRIRATPTLAGYRLLGWYTKAQGGEWITTVTSQTPGTLYAHWQKIGDPVGDGVKANYVRYATEGQIVYKAPQGSKSSTLKKNAKLTIVADYMDDYGIKWGRLSKGGWVDLTKTREAQQENQGKEVNLKITVTSGDVNIRKGPGTSFPKNGKVKRGQVLQLTYVQPGGSYLWGQFADGWICLDYTDYEAVIKENSGDANKVTATGVIINTEKLNIRSRPSASSTKVGQYSKGDKVQITLQQKVGSTTWGKTDKGWISLYYVKLTPVEGNVTIDPKPTEPKPVDPAPSEPEKPSTDKNEVIATGTVVNCNSLRVRAGAGVKYDQVGSLKGGTKVSIYEMTIAGKQVWGRVSNGWVCMDYVLLDSIDPDEDTPAIKKIGVVANCNNLNVRAGAGTKYPVIGKLPAGTQVEILDTAVVGRQNWCRITQGWVCMDYIKVSVGASEGGDKDNEPAAPKPEEKPETPGTTPNTPDTTPDTTPVHKVGVITGTNTLRVRSKPGVDNKQVGTLKKGDKVVILETTKVGGATWGRIESGWIHMHYVKLNSETVPAGAVIRTVTASSLRIRAGAGTKYDQVGSYQRGAEIVILEQTKAGGQLWGRTDKGWVCMEYVK